MIYMERFTCIPLLKLMSTLFNFCINIKNYLGGNIKGSLDFAKILIENTNVAVAPGIDFGDDSICRISLTNSRVYEGMERVCNFLSQLS